MVASTREAVSKVMSEFQRGGLIEVRGRRIIRLPAAGGGPPRRPSLDPGCGGMRTSRPQGGDAMRDLSDT